MSAAGWKINTVVLRSCLGVGVVVSVSTFTWMRKRSMTHYTWGRTKVIKQQFENNTQHRELENSDDTEMTLKSSLLTFRQNLLRSSETARCTCHLKKTEKIQVLKG